ncbi:MAG TPA: ABC transporter permease [Terriglobia bacterium]|nr:ABC transporter permease [Terriglobia bacterium]
MLAEWASAVWLRMKALFRRRQLDRDLEEEIKFHLAMREQKLAESGVPAEEARYAARREFGNATQAKEANREMWTFPFLETLWQDSRYGLRQLRRNPGFTAVAVITLALGIGANTAVFSIVDAILLRPLPYKNADRLTVTWQRLPKDRIGLTFDTYREFEQWQQYSHSFQKLAAATWARDAGAVLSWHGKKREMLAVPVSVDFFSLLGIRAAQGRTFEAEDLKNPCTAVLAHSFWQERLGGTPGWVGKSLILNNTACTVVGIMPKDFSFYPKQTQLWTLITPDSDFAKKAWDMPVGVFGLLKPGVGRAAAQAELNGLESRILTENPSLAAMKLQPNVLDLQWEFTWLTGRNLRSSLVILFAAVIFVLLIACVNVANLLLGRGSARQKELGVRAALGSGRSRLIRQLLTEGLILWLGGAVLGAIMAFFCVRYIDVAEATQLPPGNPVSVNWEVLVFTVFLAILTGMLFGLLPAWKISRVNLNEVLKESSGTASRGALSHSAGRAFVVAEMALSLIVLVAAGLLVESLVRLTNAPLGYERDHVLTAQVRLPVSSYPKAADWKRFWDRLGSQLELLPGVEGVAFGPLVTSWGSTQVSIEGTDATSRIGSSSGPDAVSNAYFQILGIPLLRGREFTGEDRQRSMPAAIVNQAFVNKFFPKGNSLGQHIKLGRLDAAKPWLTIVGVVGNVSHPNLFMGYDEGPDVYRPLRQDPQGTLSLFVHTAGSGRSVESSIGRAVTAVDSNLPPPSVQTITQWLSWFAAQPRFRAELFGTFAALALLLAVVGIYGVLSQLVTQRTHEIGIRVALGAQKHDVLRLVVGRGMIVAAIGVAIGIAGAFGLTRFLSNMLYDVKPIDPLTFTVVSLILLGVALLACYIPARRAAKVDPMVALRHE